MQFKLHALYFMLLWSCAFLVLARAQEFVLPKGQCVSFKSLPYAKVPEGYCASVYATATSPRGAFVSRHGLIVVERTPSRLTLFRDLNSDGVIDTDPNSSERLILATASGLNHGVYGHNGYLYASSSSTVWRWSYDDTAEPKALSNPLVAIKGIPNGGHTTRTLLVDDTWIYVTVGSRNNTDFDSSRSRVKRFRVNSIPNDGYDFVNGGEVFADGVRNEVGLTFDRHGVVWGVMNNIDNLNRADLGGDIHNDNPGEDVHKFVEDQAGSFWGYPYCWSEFLLPPQYAKGKGYKWATPNTMATYPDSWCTNTTNVQRSAAVLPAHSAPLGISFNKNANGVFSSPHYADHAFVAYHGSWNRSPPTGYKVVRLPMKDGNVEGEEEDFLAYSGTDAKSANWTVRPVNAVFGPNGELFVTSDSSNQIIVVRYLNQDQGCFSCTNSGVMHQASLWLMAVLILAVTVMLG